MPAWTPLSGQPGGNQASNISRRCIYATGTVQCCTVRMSLFRQLRGSDTQGLAVGHRAGISSCTPSPPRPAPTVVSSEQVAVAICRDHARTLYEHLGSGNGKAGGVSGATACLGALFRVLEQ